MASLRSSFGTAPAVLDEGELFVVPRGVEHCPRAREEAQVLLIEPRGTVNRGDAVGSDMMAVERAR
jgi:mannose-6-phosphate isomerase-like protein (cupin superfamily)